MKYSVVSFASDTGISEDLAKRILELLYEHDLTAEEMNSVLWRLRDWFTKNQMPKLMEKLTDEEIGAVMDQLIAERAMWQSECPKAVCYATSWEEMQAAFNNATMPESAWFFSQIEDKKEKYAEGDVVTIQIFRTGTWEHPAYGKVEISKKTIKEVVENFANRERGIDLCVDENHEPDHKALGWYKEVYSSDNGTKCFAKVELTAKGADLLNDGAYKYFSPEIVFHKIDEETGEPQSNLLIGGAFTNRPFFKGMQPLMAGFSFSEVSASENSGKTQTKEGHHALFFSHASVMKKFLEVCSRLVEKSTISAGELKELELAYGELPTDDRSKEINNAFAELKAKFDEGDGTEVKPEEVKPEEPAAVEPEAEVETEVKPEVPAGVEGVQANEDGSFTVTDPAKFGESIKGIQTLASTLQRETTLAACEKLVTPLIFSEKRKDKVVLPKHKKRVVQFAASLSEKQRAEFFSIVGEFKAVPAKEVGHNQEKEINFSDPATIPEDDPQVKYFMESLKQPLADARASAAHFYATKGKR